MKKIILKIKNFLKKIIKYNYKDLPKKIKKDMPKIKRKLLGKTLSDGILGKIVIYGLLITIGFVYIFPIINMFLFSLKDLNDLIDPRIMWVPSKFYFQNYAQAFKVLSYWKVFFSSLLVTLIPAILQVITTSIIGYGLAKFEFKGKKIVFLLILATYIVPQQTYLIPKYVLFSSISLLETPFAIILPALFGQGIFSAIFILIFYQFFRMQPKVLDESAEIDGASKYTIFFKIGVPLATPAYITSFLFSFVWYWNETYVSSLMLGTKVPTLQLKLGTFVSDFNRIFQNPDASLVNESIKYAATLLIILPLLITYFSMQKLFVEGVDRSGVTGE